MGFNIVIDEATGIMLLLLNVGVLVVSVRWLWVNYKASKIVLEFAEIFREAMEREAQEDESELETEGSENGGKSNGSHY